MQYNDEIKKQFFGLNTSNFTIYRARSNVFVCGGEVDIKTSNPSSYRDELFDYSAKKYPDLHDYLIKAEDFKDYYRNGNYRDLLSFEDDIAHIAALVVIILESPGALVELGLYCYREQFLEKLVVIADEQVYSHDSDSFISLGPLAFIQSHPDSCVLSHQFPNECNQYTSDVEDLCNHILEKLKQRTKRRFESNNNGHIAFVVAEVVRITFPIMLNEIETCLSLMSMPIQRSKLQQLLYVLEKMRIIVLVTKSDNSYYCPVVREAQFASFGKKADGRNFSPDEVFTILKMSFINGDETMSDRRRRALNKYMETQNGD